MFNKLFDHSYCLVCHEDILANFGWVDLIKPDHNENDICSSCQNKLQSVEGETCEICGRPFAFLDDQYRMGNTCFDCLRWEDDVNFKGMLIQNYSLYMYNDFLKEIIAKFKYRGDYVLAKLFAKDIKSLLIKLEPELIIPIPLSAERLYERGFNQAEALIVEAGFQPSKVLTRIHCEKQSKKSRNERIHLAQVFDTIQRVSGKVVLVDDIYTTGSTLRQAAKALKEAGADTVLSVTVARG